MKRQRGSDRMKPPRMHKHNPSYRELFEAEKGEALTEFGAMAVDTGKFTGRSPEDKWIVASGKTRQTVWWRDEKHPHSPNKSITPQTWERLRALAQEQLARKSLYVMDGFLGARGACQLKVRLLTEIPWQAHFFKNMFLRPKASLSGADWTIYCASKAIVPEWEKYGLNSEVAVALNMEKREIVILGTWYGGEIKKGMFTVANYTLPLQGIGSFHCSANVGSKNDAALFFGLSGTGKTTLSHDPKRKLIGDDEHGWDEQGIFNLEGGCYAKVINLSKEGEPHIYKAIKRNALLENVVVDKKGEVDFGSSAKTENTRVSYPIEHVGIRVKGALTGPHPKTVIFLTCDSFGILPPVAKLNREQALYWFLTGYTAKVAGTERGVTEPKAAFSACFGQPFLPLHPTVYARILGEKLKRHKTQVFLVNTGWTGGGYGVGKRISLQATRQIITEILEGRLGKAAYQGLEPFGLMVPKAISNVDSKILIPKNTWADTKAYDAKAQELVEGFIKNFERFSDTKEGKAVKKWGPRA